LEFEFLKYDRFFAETPMTVGNTLGGVGSLLLSGAVHGIGDIFRPRRAFGDLGEKTKWYAGMVTQWAADATLRRKLCDELESALRTFKPDLVCAHSLGTLLSYDLFAEQGRAPGSESYAYVTFGSQIGNPTVRQAFGGRLVPIGARYWFNLYNRHDDVFTTSIRIPSEYYEELSTDFDRPGTGDHDADGYLTHVNATDGAWRRLARGEFEPRLLTRRSLAMRERVSHALPATASPLKVAQAAAAAPRQRALLIGINEYPNPEHRLEGCVNDVFLMSSVLQECGFAAEDIRIVLDDRATAQGIRERLEWLLADARPGDVCFLYYSGHGAQLPGYGAGDTFERLDECLVAWDFDGSRETAVTDDHFYDLYSQLPYDARFVAVFDCCHSGGISRAGQAKVRGVNLPDDIRHRMLRWDAGREMWVERELKVINPDLDPAQSKDPEEARAYTGESGAKRRLGRAASVREVPDEKFDALCRKYRHKGPYLPLILEACGENEFSYEYKHGSHSYGAFTYSLATILRRLGRLGRTPSFQDLRDLVAQQLADLGYQQRPKILGPRGVRQTAVPWHVKKTKPTKPRKAAPRSKKARGKQTSEQITEIILSELERQTLLLSPTLDTKTGDWFADIEKADRATGKKTTRNDDFLNALRHRIKKSFTLGKAELITRDAFPTPLHLVARIV
jgi:hypothetical protein